MSKEEYKAFAREKSKVEKIRSEMHSLWCTELYRLSIANMVGCKLNTLLGN